MNYNQQYNSNTNITAMFTLTEKLLKKIQTEMRITYITATKPKQQIKLDPIDPQDINIELQNVIQWSPNNQQLYHKLLDYGMAAYICNRQYLYQFYQELNFQNCSIKEIDKNTLLLKNIHTLNLQQNNIKIFQLDNIPFNCKVLYLDFNGLQSIHTRNKQLKSNIELLSVSHNNLTDSILTKLSNNILMLRCLDISYNYIYDLNKFVDTLKKLLKLKIVISKGNPISLLKIYYKYIIDNLKSQLEYFECTKIDKEQPKKQKKQEKIQPKVQIKKEQKKDNKKDNKKGGKQQKIIEEPIQAPKQIIQQVQVITQQNFNYINLQLSINNYQQMSLNQGIQLDLTLENVQSSKLQTCYWIQIKINNQDNINNYQNKVAFDSGTIENQQVRFDLGFKFNHKYQLNQNNFHQLQKGIIVTLWKEQPQLAIDPTTLEEKPVINQGQLLTNKYAIGSAFIDLRELYSFKQKNLLKKFRLFPKQIVEQPLFRNPYENQFEFIAKNLQQFENKLKQEQQQRLKKIEEQQAAKAQKKGGKDQKKPPQKKAAKKQGKDPQVIEKKKVDKCLYQINQKEYCYLGQNKMYKGSKDLLCICLKIK